SLRHRHRSDLRIRDRFSGEIDNATGDLEVLEPDRDPGSVERRAPVANFEHRVRFAVRGWKWHLLCGAGIDRGAISCATGHRAAPEAAERAGDALAEVAGLLVRPANEHADHWLVALIDDRAADRGGEIELEIHEALFRAGHRDLERVHERAELFAL